MPPTDRPLPLVGVRILDLGRVYQGPYAGLLLALAGAEVIKVEEPDGEPARRGGGELGTTIPLALLNSNKKAITLDHLDELDALITEWTSRRSRADVLATLHAAKVPVSAVREVPELIDDPHLHERGALQRIDHPALGEIVVPHSPLRFRGSALLPVTPSPRLGEHNDEILGS